MQHTQGHSTTASSRGSGSLGIRGRAQGPGRQDLGTTLTEPLVRKFQALPEPDWLQPQPQPGSARNPFWKYTFDRDFQKATHREIRHLYESHREHEALVLFNDTFHNMIATTIVQCAYISDAASPRHPRQAHSFSARQKRMIRALQKGFDPRRPLTLDEMACVRQECEADGQLRLLVKRLVYMYRFLPGQRYRRLMEGLNAVDGVEEVTYWDQWCPIVHLHLPELVCYGAGRA